MGFFDKYTNYNDQAGVSSVVFGANRSVLEVELNEMQEVSKELLRNMIAKVCGNGVTDISKITYENGAVKIASGCGIAVDGILINCTGLSKSATSGTIYLQVWEETVDYTDTLKKEGNQQESATVTNYIKDSRANEETTRRMVVKYDLATSTNNSRHNLAIASISGGKMTRLVNEINLSNIRADLDDTKGYIGMTDPDIYGVEADWKNNKFTRLASAIGKSGGVDFDNIRPWDRRRCNVTDDGKVVAYYGDEGYTETGKLTQAIAIGSDTYSVGTRVQVMVEQHKFYYRMVPLELEPITDGIGFKVRKARYYISATPKSGFKLFPAFRRDGREVDVIYDSAFKGCLYDTSAGTYCTDDSITADYAVSTGDKLASIANAKPASGLTNNFTRANARKVANNVGAGWQQSDFLVDTMTAWLFLVEYAKMNAQEVLGIGVASFTDDGETNMAINTGGTSTLGNGSGMANGDSGKVSVSYRGKEDPFGNIWSFSDGINIEAKGKNIAYWADHDFADDIGIDPYQSCGFTISKANGYISAFGWSEDCDFAFLGAETSGDSSKPVGDYQWQNATYNGWLIALLGGTWFDGSYCGLCFWSLHHASSHRYRGLGSRLVYIPTAA